MLTPRKHLNLDVSVLRVSALMLKELRRRGVIEFEPLRKLVVRRVGADGDLSFLPAISFLFLRGNIDYHVKNDTIEYKVS